MATMPPGPPDEPRTAKAREHLANERTLFAWIRTALALMALGFVVARFGLFLRSIAAQQGDSAGSGIRGSEVIGVGLVVAGMLTAGAGLRSFLRARTQIEAGRFVPDLIGDLF